MAIDSNLLIYLLPLGLIWGTYLGIRRRAESRNSATLIDAIESGLSEPPSLHPKIDPALCLGCGACVSACPEGRILGLVNGKAKLIEPSECIGHGACRSACPRGAISLVFGTASRGVEIPEVGPDFQTNIPGLYIAGELGGMGLIRNAIEQGRQAMEEIGRKGRDERADILDVAIVGGGPAGLSASLAAIEAGLRFVTLEQEDDFGGTVAHFPRGKLVMTQPARLPIVGMVKFREIGKEKLIAFWKSVVVKSQLRINFGERVEAVNPLRSGFEVKTAKSTYRARNVLLAIGRRGTPRKLDVPGEELSKVVYRLIDPLQYRGQHVVVVGGGDSALEAAAEIAEQQGTRVVLTYRGEAFSRAKSKNRARVAAAVRDKRLTVMLTSKILRIDPKSVHLEWDGRDIVVENDAVIVCAGGILPTGFLKQIGVETGMKYGTA